MRMTHPYQQRYANYRWHNSRRRLLLVGSSSLFISGLASYALATYPVNGHPQAGWIALAIATALSASLWVEASRHRFAHTRRPTIPAQQRPWRPSEVVVPARIRPGHSCHLNQPSDETTVRLSNRHRDPARSAQVTHVGNDHADEITASDSLPMNPSENPLLTPAEAFTSRTLAEGPLFPPPGQPRPESGMAEGENSEPADQDQVSPSSAPATKFDSEETCRLRYRGRTAASSSETTAPQQRGSLVFQPFISQPVDSSVGRSTGAR